MGTVNIILQLFLSLSILVVLHELGHFLPAKWFKTRVEKFYLFFDPYFSLFKINRGGTEYGIGWLPLGGYVKISGMIDESLDTEQMKGPPQPWEFRSKKPWQKLIIMIGGVTVNFILGIFLMGLIAFIWGEDYLKNDQVKDGIAVDSMGEGIGLRDGDKIVSIGGKSFDEFNAAQFKGAIIFDGENEVVVERNGQEKKISIGEEWIKELAKYENSKRSIFSPRMPAVIGQVAKDMPGAQAGLEAGDKILAVNGSPVQYYDQLVKAAQKQDRLSLDIERAGNRLQTDVTTQYIKYPRGLKKLLGASPDTSKTLGVSSLIFAEHFEMSHRDFSFGESVKYGFTESFSFLGSQIKAFGKMLSGKIAAKESLGGFISIAKIFPETWDWKRFWRMTAILSLILGFMNILPIPALDGGHILFLLIEMVTGRQFSDKFIERATTFGFFILIALMIYVNGLDIWRALK